MIMINKAGKKMTNEEMKGELEAVQNSLALILQQGIVQQNVPPQSQKLLVQKSQREVKRLKRRYPKGEDRQLVELMMILQILEAERW